MLLKELEAEASTVQSVDSNKNAIISCLPADKDQPVVRLTKSLIDSNKRKKSNQKKKRRQTEKDDTFYSQPPVSGVNSEDSMSQKLVRDVGDGIQVEVNSSGDEYQDEDMGLDGQEKSSKNSS